MISKKSRKVIAAVLIGATICASGTFAYFNSVLDLGSELAGMNNNVKQLNITNGKVEISGKIDNTAVGSLSSLYYYDVASKSAKEDLLAYAKTTLSLSADDSNTISTTANLTSLQNKAKALGISVSSISTTSKYSDLKNLSVINDADFINRHLSPDFASNGTALSANTSKSIADANKVSYDGILYDISASTGNFKKDDLVKAINKDLVAGGKTEISNALTSVQAIKDAVSGADATNDLNLQDKFADYAVAKQGATIENGAITFARPGDAIAFGKFDDSTKEQKGLEIVNNSNITTKLSIRLKTDTTGAIDADVKSAIEGLAQAGWVLYINDARFDFDEYINNGSLDNAVKDLQSELEKNSAIYTKAGATVELKVRLELPLSTGNYYQERNTTNQDSSTFKSFDVSRLFDIVATQVNNPGVNEDGTNDPLKSTLNTNKGKTDATKENDNGQLKEGTLFNK